MKSFSLRVWRVLYVTVPLALGALLAATRSFWVWLSQHLPPCLFYQYTGLYCPGCGNSRSVRALLNGEIWLSLRYNVLPILFLVLVLLWYIEWGVALFARRTCRLLPRHPAVLATGAVLLLAYFVLRNVFACMPV